MDSTHLSRVVFAVIATYAIHSTALLSLAWLADRHRWMKSPLLRERLWKWAALSPLLSTALQIAWTGVTPVWELQMRSGAAEFEPLAATAVPAMTSERLADLEEQSRRMTPHAAPRQDSGQQTVVASAVQAVAGSPESGRDVPVQENVTVERQAPIGKPAFRNGGEECFVRITPGGDSRSDARTGNRRPLSNRQSEAPVVVLTPRNRFHDADSSVSPASAAVEPTADSPSRGDQAVQQSGASGSTAAGDAAATTPVIPPDPAENSIAATAAEGAVEGAVEAASTVPLPRTVTMVAVGGILWFVAGLSMMGLSLVRVAFVLRAPATATPHVVSLLARICAQRGIPKKVRVLSCKKIAEPSACGILNPTILLPAGIEQKLTDDEMVALLSHELSHLIRRDTLWILVGQVLTASLSWQLLNLLAVRRWQQAAEFQCDDWAAQDERSRVTLARVLTTVAELKSKQVFRIGVPATAPPLSQRVERLLSFRPTSRHALSWPRRAALLAVMLMIPGAVFVFAPRLVWADSKSTRIVQPSSAIEPSSAIDTTRIYPQASSTGELSQMNDDLHRLVADLELALDLLRKREPKEDIRIITESIQTRLEIIQKHADQLKMPTAESHPTEPEFPG